MEGDLEKFPLNAQVECIDGPCGKSITMIVNPTTGTLTYLVIEDKTGRKSVERLVPIEQVLETSPALIRLACTQADLAEMEPFVETQYVESGAAARTYSTYADHYYAPYVTVEDVQTPMDVERIPAGEIAVRRGTKVEATDGYVGIVGELVVDPDSETITHFVLQESNLWGKKELTLPLSAIDFTMQGTVHLKLDKKAIEQLPTIPLKRKYTEGEVQIEVMARVFDDPDKASEALEFVGDLHRRKVIKILNAAVLVKDEDGKASLKDTRDIDPKKGRLLGAITGGLIGLVGGPVGMVIGALTGLGAGSLAGKWIDFGFSDQFLKGLQEHMQPDSSALIVLVEHQWDSELSTHLDDLKGAIFQQTLTDELVQAHMEEHGEEA